MKFNLVQFLLAVSTALDFVELDKLNKVTNHGKRVAVISAKIGHELGLSGEEIFDLAAYAVMHDNGYTGYTKKSNNSDGLKGHCIAGEDNIKNFPFLVKRKDIILYHHENYDGSGPFFLSGDQIPLFSQIIRIADYTENLMNAGAALEKVMLKVRQGRGSLFSPEIMDIFDKLTETPNFKLDLEDMFIDFSVKDYIPEFFIRTNWSEIKLMTKTISKIIDDKSDFTATHSSGIAEKIGIMADYYQFDFEKKEKLITAAYLHDVGKLAMPNAILDKPGALTSEEFTTIKQHTYYTRKVLCQVDDFEEITEWASNHHEKLNGKGYPYGFDASRLDFCSRLMTCIDIYQALTEERPYREGLGHEKTMDILRKCVERGEVDPDIVKDVDKVFQIA